MSGWYDIINIVGAAIDVLIAFSFFSIIADKKELESHRRWVITCCILVFRCGINLVVKQQIVVVVCVYLSILAITFLFKMITLKRIISSFALELIMVLSEIITGLLLATVSNASVEQVNSNVFYYIQGALMSKVIVYMVIKVIGQFSTKVKVKIAGYLLVPFMALPIATFTIVYVMSEYMFYVQTPINRALSIVAIIGLVVSNVLLFYFFEHHMQAIDVHNKEQLIRQQLEYNVKYYKDMAGKQRISNKAMHDLKNQLFAVNEILKSDKEIAITKINEICNNVLDVYSMKYTGNESVDALISYKVQDMKERGIQFRHTIYIVDSFNVGIWDLCALLGNLLDNAIEATEKVIDGEKNIELVISQNGNYLSINVNNTVKGTVTIEKNKIKTTKKDKELHGFGLENIGEIVKSYNGTSSYKQEGDRFYAVLMLMME